MSGSRRHHRIGALRSLLRQCKKTGTIFRDPAGRVRAGRQEYSVVIPLQANEISGTLDAATGPAVRVAMTSLAVHAARPHAIWAMRLDVGDRRLIIDGKVRPLDELTHQVLTGWLEHRRNRWPHTSNPHLIINQQRAGRPPRQQGLDHRQPARAGGDPRTPARGPPTEEALTRGPDPLHLVAVFGRDDKTAIRYANAARQILETAAEQHAPET